MSVLAIAVALTGGLALFVYGMGLLSSGMLDLAGARLRQWVGAAVRHRWAGLAIGFALTVLMQSSAASSVLFVSLVDSGMLAFSHTIALLLGAMAGSALTAQLLAFSFAEYALLLVALGAVIKLACRYRRQRDVADMLLGIGFLFYGMGVMRNGAAGLKDYPAFIAVFEEGLRRPWLGFAASTLFTAVAQNSSATVAVAFSFAGAGLLGEGDRTMLINAVPMILGANVGTAATALIAGIRAGRTGMRCAVANAAFRLVSAVACMFLVSPFADATLWLGSLAGPVSIERLIANGHLLFGVLNAAIYIPFVRQIAALFTWLLPDKPKPAVLPELAGAVAAPNDFPAEHARLARGLAHCIGMVDRMASRVAEQVASPSASQLERIGNDDEAVDQGYEELRGYAMLLYRLPSLLGEREQLARIIRAGEIIERLGDDFSRSAVRVLQKMERAGVAFSLESCASLQSFMRSVHDVLERLRAAAVDAQEGPPPIQRQIDALKSQLDSMRRSHFQALSDNIPAAVKSSEYLLDILSELESSLTKLRLLARLFAQDARGAHGVKRGTPLNG